MSTLRIFHRRWGFLVSTVLAGLLLLPMSRHGSEEFVLCVEKNGAVNVERARNGECAAPSQAEQAHDHASSMLHPLETEHCTSCTDVPLTLGEAHEPCESAVLSPAAFGELIPAPVLDTGRDLAGNDRHAATTTSRAKRPRAPGASAASFWRQNGHLFADTSIVRAKSSVELLI